MSEPASAAASKKVVVAGLGYVGLPLAVRAAEVGFAVAGIDPDSRRVDAVAVGRSYVEDVASDRLRTVVERGVLTASTDYAAAERFDVAVITVPTPLRDGSPDLAHVREATRSIAGCLRPGALVILESTTYPGTTGHLVRDLLQAGSGLRAGKDFHLGYSPERIDPGNRSWTFQTTPKIVSGVDHASLAAVGAFYGSLVETVVPVSSTQTAELAKLLENTFRHVNIALVNELAIFCHEFGVNVWEVIEAAATKPFGFMRFLPGPGVGGHCLPIDPVYLSWQVERATGRPFRFVDLALNINDQMPVYVVQRVVRALNARALPAKGSTVLVLGAAYKANSGDVRRTPAERIVALLEELEAVVRVADPEVAEASWPKGWQRVEATADEVRFADVVLLVTDHETFDYRMIEREARLVLDCRNRLSGPNVEVL